MDSRTSRSGTERQWVAALPITLDLDRYRPRLARAPCTACDGRGTLDDVSGVSFPGILNAQRRCPACGGRGTVGTRVVSR